MPVPDCAEEFGPLWHQQSCGPCDGEVAPGALCVTWMAPVPGAESGLEGGDLCQAAGGDVAKEPRLSVPKVFVWIFTLR